MQAARLRLLDLVVAPRCRRLVDSLDLPPDATVADLRELIEELQQRHIVVRYVDRDVVRAQTQQPSAKAAWLPGVDGQIDLLLVDAAAWHSGRDHNLRHEFGHMLLGHECRDNGELALGERLEMLHESAAKNFLEAKPLPALARGEWASARERETELVATVLGRRLLAVHSSTARTETSLADARARHMMGVLDDVVPKRTKNSPGRRTSLRMSRQVELTVP